MTVELELLVYVIGLDCGFSVTINSSKTVDDLKKAIFKECRQELSSLPSYRLSLYQVSLPGDETLAQLALQASQENLKLNITSRLSKIFPEQPPKETVSVVVVLPSDSLEGPESPLKRRRVSSKDMSEELLQLWKLPSLDLPQREKITEFLHEQLKEREKVPVSQETFDLMIHKDHSWPLGNCAESDLATLFRVHDFERTTFENFFTTPLVVALPDLKGSKRSFIYLWDSHIRIILNTIIGPECRIIRDSDQEASTRRARPDFVLNIHNLCLFRGEEKGISDGYGDPRKELIKKLDAWTYGPAPYIFGYYACGCEVTYVVMFKPVEPGSKPEIRDLCTVNLKYRRDRLKSLVFLIRLSSLLLPLANLIGARSLPDYIRIQRDHGKAIELQGDKILKVYCGPDDSVQTVRRLREIYDVLVRKNVTHTDKLHSYLEMRVPPDIWPYVKTFPLGDSRQPSNELEVLEAVSCVLRALIVTHGAPDTIIHRDIRWPNVMRSLEDHHEWFLIDWEHASFTPALAIQDNFEPTTHCPTTFHPNHGCEVDVWGVGHLLYSAEESDKALRDLGRHIKEESSTGLDASGALDKIRPFLESQLASPPSPL